MRKQGTGHFIEITDNPELISKNLVHHDIGNFGKYLSRKELANKCMPQYFTLMHSIHS